MLRGAGSGPRTPRGGTHPPDRAASPRGAPRPFSAFLFLPLTHRWWFNALGPLKTLLRPSLPHGSWKILKSPQNTTRGIAESQNRLDSPPFFFFFFTDKPPAAGSTGGPGDTQVQSGVPLGIFGHSGTSRVSPLLPAIRRGPARSNSGSETTGIFTGQVSPTKRCCGTARVDLGPGKGKGSFVAEPRRSQGSSDTGKAPGVILRPREG